MSNANSFSFVSVLFVESLIQTKRNKTIGRHFNKSTKRLVNTPTARACNGNVHAMAQRRHFVKVASKCNFRLFVYVSLALTSTSSLCLSSFYFLRRKISVLFFEH